MVASYDATTLRAILGLSFSHVFFKSAKLYSLVKKLIIVSSIHMDSSSSSCCSTGCSNLGGKLIESSKIEGGPGGKITDEDDENIVKFGDTWIEFEQVIGINGTIKIHESSRPSLWVIYLILVGGAHIQVWLGNDQTKYKRNLNLCKEEWKKAKIKNKSE